MNINELASQAGLKYDKARDLINELGIQTKRGRYGTKFSVEELERIYQKFEEYKKVKKSRKEKTKILTEEQIEEKEVLGNLISDILPKEENLETLEKEKPMARKTKELEEEEMIEEMEELDEDLEEDSDLDLLDDEDDEDFEDDDWEDNEEDFDDEDDLDDDEDFDDEDDE